MKIRIVGIFPKYSALWNYGFYLSKYLSKNKRFDVKYINLWNNKKYHNEILRAIALLNGIKTENCDVLILAAPLLAKSLLKTRAKMKIIILYDFYPLTIGKDVSLPVKLLIKNTYKYIKKADILIPISNFGKQEAKKLYELKNKIIKVNGGLNDFIFKKLNVKKEEIRKRLGIPNKTIFLHVGRDDYRKNFRFVLELFNKLKTDKQLVKIGEVSKSDLEFIKNHGLSRKIIMMKNVDEKKLNEVYNASDILLFPSLYEGLGLPPIEAMACGLPVIAAEKTGLKESCIKESFVELNLNKWEKKIEKILNDSKFRKKMIKKGLKYAKKFNWKNYSKKVEKIIIQNF